MVESRRSSEWLLGLWLGHQKDGAAISWDWEVCGCNGLFLEGRSRCQEFSSGNVELHISVSRPNLDIRKAIGNTSVDVGREVWARDIKECWQQMAFKARRLMTSPRKWVHRGRRRPKTKTKTLQLLTQSLRKAGGTARNHRRAARELGGIPRECGILKAKRSKCVKDEGVIHHLVRWADKAPRTHCWIYSHGSHQ